MSFSKMGKVFPKMGKEFPSGSRAQHYALVVAGALHDELGETHHAIKTVIRWTGANERTIKNWFAGSSGPSGEHLVALLRHSDDVFEAILILSGREERPSVATERYLEVREKLREALLLLQTMCGDA